MGWFALLISVLALVVAIWAIIDARLLWKAEGAQLSVTTVLLDIRVDVGAAADPAAQSTGTPRTTYVIANTGRLQTTIEYADRPDVRPGTGLAMAACGSLPLTLKPGQVGLLIFVEETVALGGTQRPGTYVGDLRLVTSDGALHNLKLPSGLGPDEQFASEVLRDSLEDRREAIHAACDAPITHEPDGADVG